jgi:O-antigen ligase
VLKSAYASSARPPRPLRTPPYRTAVGCSVTPEHSPVNARSRTPWWQLDLSDLGFVYGVLLALSITLINPWGTPRGGIWTDPKVYTLIALALLTWVVLFGVALTHWRRQPANLASLLQRAPISRLWVAAALLWLAFLASGLVTVLLSPVSFQSALMPQVEMGDGWVYWAWTAAFTLGNALLLARFPALFRAQLFGLLAGGVISSLAVVVQSWNWQLDFTATMGRTLSPVWLESRIHQGQMPIGLTSNRGHVAFILAALAVLSALGHLRGWLQARVAWPLYAFFLLGLYLTSSRGPQLAFAAGMLYLLVRFWRQRPARTKLLALCAPLVLGVLALGATGLGPSRNLPSLRLALTNLDAFTSARAYLWPSAVAGIRQRPLFGWGFNGYGLAWPHVNDFDERWAIQLARDARGQAIGVVRIGRHNHNFFQYLGTDGNLYLGRVLTNKAHNIVLDTAVSVGLVGLLLYSVLFGTFVYGAARGRGYGLEAVAVVYLAFGLTWFESAQYSHLAWWALSAGLAHALPRTREATQPRGDPLRRDPLPT